MLAKIKHFVLRPRRRWEKNLIILWFGTFMAGIAFSLVMPFLSLYIDTLGTFSTSQLNFYSGITYASTFLVTAIISPIWGRLADRKGRKLMILRASLGMAFVIGLMGLVTNIYQLIFLRLIQGVFSGYISNANALVATETPKDQSGKALGILTTGSVSGTLFGPFVGGVIAALFGYRVTFFITGAILILVFLLSAFFVHETYQPASSGPLKKSWDIFKGLRDTKLVIGMLVATFLIQLGNFSISPIISLYVREIMHNSGPITIASGLVVSIPGVATLLAAPRLGILGDKIGTTRILKLGMLFAVIVFLPMAFVINIWQFGFLRFLIGISNAAMLPAVQTLLAKNTPTAATGRIFSYNQSFQALGSVAGPLIGSSISGIWDYNGVFISTALILFLGLLWVNFATKSKNT
ncbi:multidrug efflux MFS transporter [Liquorilactobacillus capillatus]|uniref:Major facilitator superfamily protein n=1 Tax=Liquorilactobacillus capillatus DSM 19910 TaxID=1423731 RepID=A0A0R1MCE7_9LACO|nr:multidrug efflux MFS transporter [Liquorilactobacillus capillatus]KRL01843.1 major facilitator superfamily protein [Liquorilactobacillus capillatus DSM 19910]